MAHHHCPEVTIRDGKFVNYTDVRLVRVMARAEGYVMVRRKGCAPYVVSERELTPATEP
jgi:hypothetical protein